MSQPIHVRLFLSPHCSQNGRLHFRGAQIVSCQFLAVPHIKVIYFWIERSQLQGHRQYILTENYPMQRMHAVFADKMRACRAQFARWCSWPITCSESGRRGSLLMFWPLFGIYSSTEIKPTTTPFLYTHTYPPFPCFLDIYLLISHPFFAVSTFFPQQKSSYLFYPTCYAFAPPEFSPCPL